MEGIKRTSCPLCGSGNAVFHSYPQSNLYSEKMASILLEPEQELLVRFHNVCCTQCGLIYKLEMYPEWVIASLFRDVVPEHPKGWDVMSGRFSAMNFFKELTAYEEAIASNNIEQENRYRRALLSIIDSIYPHEPNADLKNKLSEQIHKKEIHRIREQEALLTEVIKEPMPFKRFSGFSSPALWAYFESVCGEISQYDELGCPLWGLLSYAHSKGVDVRFMQRTELNYWGDQCKHKGITCTHWLHQEHRIPMSVLEENTVSQPRQLVGFFQYLDHLTNPMLFLTTVFDQYQSAAIILDGVDEPVYIQHVTGFTSESLQYIATHFGKSIYSDFDLITPSGNKLYLFK